MKWRRTVAVGVSEMFSHVRKIYGHPRGLRVLLYHSVGSHLSHDSYGISIKSRLFERHTAILSGRKDINIVSIHKKQLPSENLNVAVTFDDGYKDNLYIAAPILLSYNIPFTVFVTAAFVGSSYIYLNTSELKELSALNGVTIGSHGLTHACLAHCDDSALRKELSESRVRLEDIIGKPVTSISYPHGSVDRRVRDEAAKAGYDTGGCSMLGINDSNRDRLLLKRTEVVGMDSERIFLQKLLGAWDWYGRIPRYPANVRLCNSNIIDKR